MNPDNSNAVNPGTNSSPLDPKVAAEAMLIAQDVWKSGDAQGSATVDEITYKVDHGQVVRLPNGEVDIAQLPTIEFSITKPTADGATAKTGDVYVKMGYSGTIIEAYGDVIDQGNSSRYELNPAESVAVATEVLRIVRASKAAPID